jgi:hypothetical protein
VSKEKFSEDDTVLLDRSTGGIGKLLAAKTGDRLDFQTPESELAAVSRRDSLQHPFFEKLHLWGNGVRLFQFGTPLGKDHLMFL